MFQPSSAFSGFSVKDADVAKVFYSEKLGLSVDQDWMGLQLHLPHQLTVFVYTKENHQPATYTVLNFVVSNIDDAIEELTSKGITFEQYNDPNLPQDEKGVLRGLSAKMGPDIAWFKDPSGNILSVLQEK